MFFIFIFFSLFPLVSFSTFILSSFVRFYMFVGSAFFFCTSVLC